MRTSKIKKKEQLNISMDAITRWGMLRQVMFEQIVDSNLRDVQYPESSQIRKIIKSWCEEKHIKGDEELRIWKKKNGFNEIQWNDYVTRKWRWTKWCIDKFSKRIPNYYLEKKSILDKAQYSLVRVTSENLANELYLRIKEQESTFEEIAKSFSEGPEKYTDGIVGPESIGNAHPALAKLLKISNEGQIWPPKKVEKWWIIVRLNYIQNTSLDQSMLQKLALELGLKYVEEFINNESNKNE